jgi:hypothetical protein
MKHWALVILLGAGLAPGAFAQDSEHVQFGVFADYFHLSETGTDFAGLGARFSFVAYQELKLEAEMSYDFNRVFTEGFTDDSTTPPTITLQRSDIRLLHGMFGPRLNIGRHHVQPFLTAKGGFINSSFSTGPANASGFTSSVNNLRANNVIATFYPGGGIEAHLGPVGLRLDVGDEMYFSGGTHHNLRAAFGPFIRF